MQGNKFYGPIPSSLRSLRGLSVWDFAQNNLSGEIPKFLAGFKLLENVNLSYNDLGARYVPTEGVIKNSSATSVMGTVSSVVAYQNCNFLDAPRTIQAIRRSLED